MKQTPHMRRLYDMSPIALLYKRLVLVALALCCCSLAEAQLWTGLKLGMTYYQPKTEFAQDMPRPGNEIGVTAKVHINQTGWRIMPEFGYFMGNANVGLNQNSLDGAYYGIDPGQVERSTLMMHNLSFGVFAEKAFGKREQFTAFFGPEVFQNLGQTHIIRYYVPGGGDAPIQEAFGGDLEGVPNWYFNVRYGAAFRVAEQSKQIWQVYVALIHQTNRQPWWPAGAVIGLRAYFPALFRR